MKTILHICLFVFFVTYTNAQSTVNIQINHLLNGVEFQNEVSSTNDLDNAFMIDRLQYYLSGFSLVHDGGQVTEVDELYVLISLLQKSEPSAIQLGEFEFEELEAIRFHFGVDEQANHADPSLWPAFHPLAPQFPSMHWGWTAGYRFIALEGLSGPNLNQDLQFHCIGDEFYTQMEFPVSMTGEADYTLIIDAEYSKLLEGIDVSSGLIIHGGTGEMPLLATNLSEKVFTASSVTSTDDSEVVNLFEVFPNPVSHGILMVTMDIATLNNTVKVYDAIGRVVFERKQFAAMQIELPNQGLYYVSVADVNGHILAIRKVVVQ